MRRYGIPQAIPLSLFSKDLYLDVGKNWRGLAFLYLVVLVALLSIFPVIRYHHGVSEILDEEGEAITEQIPRITIAGGECSIDEAQPYIITDSSGTVPVIIIDTTGEITSLDGQQADFLLTRTELVARGADGRASRYRLSGFGDTVIDRQQVEAWLSLFQNWLGLLLYPFWVFFSYLWQLVQAVLYAIAGLVFANLVGAPLKLDVLMSLAIVAMTPAMLLGALQLSFNIQLPLAWLLSFAVSLVYVFFAVKVHGSGDDSGGDLETNG